ncbi:MULTISPECIES: hypothetical protein [Pantoea]|jgi:hypothetical protein|uniref:hypothetical protein n=1 Tax=Pantoea TaxID=53335 RepID=UPI000AF733AA|nr:MULTISPECIES: hypothetical protein [Pantoea]MCJ7925716.1 hypothetical protein [Pantoea vagans]MBD8250197.1 hypothetical protein [Pantoea agglomerans]MDY0996955.1 hypothetical protein [Pantoea agglomerans]NQS82652.1 hypothetical protein [Pantoea agglomerans]UEG73007.1 hypothetical protein LKW31_11475 [Pantoea agglomerans]
MNLFLRVNKSAIDWAATAVTFCNPDYCRLHNFTVQADATSHCEWQLSRDGSTKNVPFVMRVQIYKNPAAPPLRNYHSVFEGFSVSPVG